MIGYFIEARILQMKDLVLRKKVIQISLCSKFQQCAGSYGKCRDDKDMEK